MLKWILGILGALLLLALGFCWYGYKELTAGGDTARVAIATSPERVWTHLVVVDSLRAWQDSGARVTTTGDSVLAVGDTLRIETPMSPTGGSGEQRMMWVVERVEEPTMLVWGVRDDSTGVVIFRRVDSLTVAGDSVILTSRFDSPVITQERTDSAGFAGRLMGGVGKMVTSAFRAIAERDLARLKERLETP